MKADRSGYLTFVSTTRFVFVTLFVFVQTKRNELISVLNMRDLFMRSTHQAVQTLRYMWVFMACVTILLGLMTGSNVHIPSECLRYQEREQDCCIAVDFDRLCCHLNFAP